MKNKLIAAVIAEAELLRENATHDELMKLDFENLQPNNSYHCIYGQMTGHCESERAVRLLNKCAKPFSRHMYQESPVHGNTFPLSRFKTSPDVSPIEYYIYQLDAKNDVLIQYLRGERETLNAGDL